MDCQAPLSMGILPKNAGMPCHALLQENLPDSGIEPPSLMTPALAGEFLTMGATEDALIGAQKLLLGKNNQKRISELFI